MNMHVGQNHDAIFALCSHDVRVARRAADLWLAQAGRRSLTHKRKAAPCLVFSGARSEVLAGIARARGVAGESIIVETRSTNTGESVRFTHDLLEERGLRFGRVLLVQTPDLERRTWAVFVAEWPGAGGLDGEVSVTSPQLSLEEFMHQDAPADLIISRMVGILDQVAQPIPEEVWSAGERLRAVGFQGYLPHPQVPFFPR